MNGRMSSKKSLIQRLSKSACTGLNRHGASEQRALASVNTRESTAAGSSWRPRLRESLSRVHATAWRPDSSTPDVEAAPPGPHQADPRQLRNPCRRRLAVAAAGSPPPARRRRRRRRKGPDELFLVLQGGGGLGTVEFFVGLLVVH
jgi:hypothetical protein